MTIDEAKAYKLSAHFTLWEMIRSHKAAKLNLYHLQLAITPEQIRKLKLICDNILEPLRAHINSPITINNGFRSKKINTLVGGVWNSEHIDGEAVDFECNDMQKAFDYIKDNCEFRQLINEYDFDWIHVSYDEKDNKKQILKT